MPNWFKFAPALKKEKGIIVVVIALSIAVFAGIAAMVIDIGYLMVTRNELQNIADAAALAAARKLGIIYEGLTPQTQQSYICDPAAIVAVAKETAIQNQAGGKAISINNADVVIGQWDLQNKTLTSTLSLPNAVRVTARRDSTGNYPVTGFFASILGKKTSNVAASATAALTGLGEISKGVLGIPVGIAKKWFDMPDFCDQLIKFHPTGTIEGCAGWHTYKEWPANEKKLRKILKDLKDGKYQIPEAVAGETTFVFTGRDVASAFDDMSALFNTMKGKDGDGNPETWTTTVVVYDASDCFNPHGWLTIIGFATAIITEVYGPPDKIIQAKVICKSINHGRGGGGDFGTIGSIPVLVQ